MYRIKGKRIAYCRSLLPAANRTHRMTTAAAGKRTMPSGQTITVHIGFECKTVADHSSVWAAPPGSLPKAPLFKGGRSHSLAVYAFWGRQYNPSTMRCRRAAFPSYCVVVLSIRQYSCVLRPCKTAKSASAAMKIFQRRPVRRRAASRCGHTDVWRTRSTVRMRRAFPSKRVVL